MTIEEMHYDFKLKLNKVDSQQNKNFLIPEIDWILNEAQEIFIKRVAEPRNKSNLGFEKSQRNIDDIRTLVKNSVPIIVINNQITLPGDYLYYIKGNVEISRGNCNNINGTLIIRQHDDNFEESPFDKSSFEWRTVNGVFFENGLKLYTDGKFIVNKVYVSYIRKPKYIHNAKDFSVSGKYNSPSGVSLIGFQNCELSEATHREIVDIAVLLATENIQAADYQSKMTKLNLNELIN
ncbi:MAG: hypothetical protein ACRC0V_07215 [Fusobacteriaceae bacterium]|uniref:hypothetical protein n=1 Tax=Romboutsia sp. TaxID=1965302 RepID=UPI003F38AE79